MFGDYSLDSRLRACKALLRGNDRYLHPIVIPAKAGIQTPHLNLLRFYKIPPNPPFRKGGIFGSIISRTYEDFRLSRD